MIPRPVSSDDADPVLLLRDAREGRWRRFSGVVETLTAFRPNEVLPALERVQSAVKDGLFAAGFLSYEAAPAFDPSFHTHPASDVPLLWFVLTRDAPLCDLPEAPDAETPPGLWTGDISPDDHAKAVRKIRELISAGRTYQVNFTFRLRARLSGDPLARFVRMAARQQGAYAGLIQTRDFALLSFSPELLFDRVDRRVRCRPMKGTLPRHPDPDRDAALAHALRADPKNQAENVMIVDMVRNDLGRIAKTGSVHVRRLFEVEPYPNVWQMTSTVDAETDAGLPDLFGALFPGASITGAPKVATMDLIRRLEPSPRGLYTGTMGFLLPGGDAQFNIAIRTLWIRRSDGQAEFGTGGGIVWDSRADDEYEETLRKAFVLVQHGPLFHLLESMRWTPETGVERLDRHLARLARSAGFFSFRFDADLIRTALRRATDGATGPLKVRLNMDFTGQPAVDASALPFDTGQPVRLRAAPFAVRSDDVLLRHKTSRRDLYDRARAAVPDCDDVVLFNERGECTETTIGNLLVRKNGEWVTPPTEAGLLPGVYREELLVHGLVREEPVRLDELASAEALAVVNSVRGQRPAVYTQ